MSRRCVARTSASAAPQVALAALLVLGCDRPPPQEHDASPPRPASVLDDRLRVAAGEPLRPERITPVRGLAYSAEIGGRVPGLREGGDGRTLRLVEDGLALGPAGALSADVVALGGGRFNHETASRILFSTSDGSDPRSNGRAYRVEWDEPAPVVPRRAASTIGLGTTEVVVDAGTERPVVARRLVLENLDPERAVRVRGRAAGAPDLTTADAIVASAVLPKMTDEQKALALWALATRWRHHDVAAATAREAADPVKLFGVYGFGFCNDVSHALASLLERAGVRARVVAWDRHTVVEARFDGGWHLLDADLGRVYRTASGRLASVADVFARRATAAFSPSGEVPLAAERFDFAYPRRSNRIQHRPLGASAHALRPVLEPGDVVVFDLRRGERPVDRFSAERPAGWPIRFANGTLRRHLPDGDDASGCRFARVAWPYPIVDLALTGRGLAADADVAVRVRGDASDAWHELRVERVAGEARASARVWVERGPIRYGVEAQVCVAGETGDDVDLALDVVFQVAPRALPAVGYGETASVWTVEDASQRPGGGDAFAGVRVTQEWDELDVPSELDVPAGGMLVNLDPAFFRPGTGFAYETALGRQLPPTTGVHPAPDAGRLALYENGRPLGPGDATPDEVATRGRGRFARAGERLVLSSSDGTDPRTNGRVYSVVLSPSASPGPSSSTYSRSLARGSLPSAVEK